VKLVSDIKGKTRMKKVLWNRVLRRIFGPKMAEVAGDWRYRFIHKMGFVTCRLLFTEYY
jgi:hypothetical protein